MNSYETIDELVANLSLLDPGEWIYVNISSWNKAPESTVFYYLPWDYIQNLEDDEIYIDEEDMEMPVVVKGLELKGWMLVSSLNYIAQKKLDSGNNNKWFVDEIDYYRENDTFRT